MMTPMMVAAPRRAVPPTGRLIAESRVTPAVGPAMPAIRSLISISSRVESPARGARRAWRGARAGPGARCAPGPGAAASGSRRPNHESPSVTGLTECQCHLGSQPEPGPGPGPGPGIRPTPSRWDRPGGAGQDWTAWARTLRTLRPGE